MISALADAVVARLTVELPNYRVDHFPDSPRDLLRFAAKSEALFVSYDGSTFGELASIDPQALDRVVEFSVNLMVRTLRGTLGMQTAVEDVIEKLFGWRPVDSGGTPLGFGRCVPVRDGFVGEEQGVWRWVVVFRATTVSVAVATTDPNIIGAPLQSVVFKEPDLP